MNILFVNKFFYNNGGSETVFFQERDYLLAKGHTVLDFSMKDKRNYNSMYSRFFVPNIDYIKNCSFKNRITQAISFVHSAVAVRKIEELILLNKPKIAHLHNIYHQLTPSIISVLKKHHIKVVVTLHDYKLICPNYTALTNGKLCIACQGKYFLNPFLKNCQQSLGRGALLSAEAIWHKWKGSYDLVDKFITPSKFMANLIHLRVLPEKTKVILNGIDTTKYSPKYDNSGYYIYFGRLSEEKGIRTLLAAHQLSRKPLPLKIVGTGPLERLSKGKYPGVEFVGYKSSQELKDLIANAAFTVVPSEWYENCSMAILESMSLGTPVIGSCIGGIPEQIENGKTGILFQMGNKGELAQKIDYLSHNRELLCRMGVKARKKLEDEYSLSQHCNQLVSLYKGLIGVPL